LSAIAVVLWAITSLITQFGQTTIAELRHAIELQTGGRMWVAIALTFTSFGCLALYDLLGARMVAPSRVPAHAALLAGFAGNAVSNTLGFHAITGIASRLVVYGRLGLKAVDVVRIVALSWLALALGFATMVAMAELATPSTEPEQGRAVLAGVLITACLAGFAAWLSRRPRTVSMLGFRQPLPSANLAMTQMLVGAVESAASVGALYVLLPPDLAPPFAGFAVRKSCRPTVSAEKRSTDFCVEHVASGKIDPAGVFDRSTRGETARQIPILEGVQVGDLLAARVVNSKYLSSAQLE
jgi:uncharacterized membrane protein YbhN (UPF0104 family)